MAVFFGVALLRLPSLPRKTVRSKEAGMKVAFDRVVVSVTETLWAMAVAAAGLAVTSLSPKPAPTH